MMNTVFEQYEAPTIHAFFTADKQDRYFQLMSNAKRRHKAIESFHHAINFEPRWSTSVDSTTDIAGRLKAKGAGPEGYLIGTRSDQTLLPLSEAIAAVERESGIVVCIPGQLAYYCGEDGERRIILERRMNEIARRDDK